MNPPCFNFRFAIAVLHAVVAVIGSPRGAVIAVIGAPVNAVMDAVCCGVFFPPVLDIIGRWVG